MRERTVLPVARERANHEARISLEQRRVREAEAIDHLRTKLLEHDVVAIDELQKHFARFGLLQIEARAALVAIEREEKSRSFASAPSPTSGGMWRR